MVKKRALAIPCIPKYRLMVPAVLPIARSLEARIKNQTPLETIPVLMRSKGMLKYGMNRLKGATKNEAPIYASEKMRFSSDWV